LRGTAKDLGKEEGMDNTFGYGLLSLHFPAGQQKPALVVVAVERSSYNIISGVGSRITLAVPFFPDVLDNNGVAHLCAHEISASKDLFDYACRFEPASGAYDPASLFAGYAAQLD
jgi:hypothetical protein